MKLNNLRAFEKHCKEACSLQPLPVYLLVSKDEAKRRSAWDSLRLALLSENNPELGLKIFSGDKASVAQLNEELDSLSFFQKKQLIYIEQADKLNAKCSECLVHYLQRPSPHIILIISTPSLRSSTQLYKGCEKEGLVLDMPVLKAWEKEKELREWLQEMAKRARKRLSTDAAQALAKHCGTQKELLESEFEKVLCYVAERPEITLTDCKALGIDNFQESVWELGSAIFRRDATQALRVAEQLIAEGTALPLLLRQLRSQFQTEFQVCCILSNGGRSKDVMGAFPYMKGRILEQHMQLAKSYGMTRFRRGVLAIDAATLKSKNSDLDASSCMSLLIARLTT